MRRALVALMCAVPAEERMLRRFAGPGVRVIATGMGAAPAELHARQAIEEGATALISVGFCGALDPALPRGGVVIPAVVRDARTGEAWPCDPVLARGAGTPRGALVTAQALTGTRAARRRLDGIAVDLESAGTARACAVAGIPFAVIRAVTDRADDDLPDLEGVVAPDGSVHPARVVGRMASRPGDIAAWVRLARGARAARRGLMPAVASALAGAA